MHVPCLIECNKILCSFTNSLSLSTRFATFTSLCIEPLKHIIINKICELTFPSIHFLSRTGAVCLCDIAKYMTLGKTTSTPTTACLQKEDRIFFLSFLSPLSQCPLWLFALLISKLWCFFLCFARMTKLISVVYVENLESHSNRVSHH